MKKSNQSKPIQSQTFSNKSLQNLNSQTPFQKILEIHPLINNIKKKKSTSTSRTCLHKKMLSLNSITTEKKSILSWVSMKSFISNSKGILIVLRPFFSRLRIELKMCSLLPNLILKKLDFRMMSVMRLENRWEN